MLDKLADTTVKNAKPKTKPYKLADGGGMYLLITPKGQKWWRLDYRLNGKRKTLSLGVYPNVKLKKARKRREAARESIDDGLDPSDIRKGEKAAREGTDTFKAVAEEWFAKWRIGKAPHYTEKVQGRLKNDVYPWLGDTVINDIQPKDLLRVLRRVESRGAVESGHRIRQHCSAVFRYAVASGYADRDPIQDLRGALLPTKPKHYASIIEPKKIGELLRAIDAYEGQLITRCALALTALTFVRPGELRKAEWSEIDFETTQWRIPAEKMKMDRPHIVPLSEQALEILKEIKPLTGSGRFLFPSIRSLKRPMSENTVTAALRGMGYSGDEMTAHGFRSMASTRLNEMGWNTDAIERQLAHVEGNTVKAAYNYAEHLEERRRMMQAWADYLDGLRSEAEVVPIHGRFDPDFKNTSMKRANSQVNF